MSLKNILAEELKLISLSREEVLQLERVASDFIKSLKGRGVRAFIGGSLAKGTLVKKDSKQDVDVFVVFETEKDTLKLEKILGRIKLLGVLKKVHGSRDYFQIDCSDSVLEVIPVVKNKNPEDALNVTDVSLSHVKYISGEIKKNPKIADEIRLAKAFCRANACYGAEGYIQGFSGYSLEILVIYFGSFAKFLKKIGKVRVIDPVKYFRNSNEVMRELNSSKLNSPIVLVDPTYKYRNVSAGLSEETFKKFLKIGAEFLKRPSLASFERKNFDVESFKGTGGRFVEIDLKTDRQEGDIAGTKMKKFFDFCVRELERKGQKILGKEFVYSGVGKKGKGYLVVLEKAEIEVRGPSIGLGEAVKAFKRANKKIVKKGKYLWRVEKVSVEKVFEKCGEVGKEIGGWGKLV